MVVAQMKTFTVDHTNSFLKACPLPYAMRHDLVANIIGQASGDLVINPNVLYIN